MPHPDPASPLTLRLFGPFEAFVNGAPLRRLRTRRGIWLLALLALRHCQGRGGYPASAGAMVTGTAPPLERAWLAGTLWPESGQRQAQVCLRQCLVDLRKALGGQAERLHAPTPRTLRLDLSGAWMDVAAFDAAVARTGAGSLEAAVRLYRGPLLEGCPEEWVLPERQQREEACLDALERLGALTTAAGQTEAGVGWLRRAVTLDPLRETAWRALLGALAAQGCHAAALEAYRELREQLRREMNADPAPETTALIHRIRAEARAQAERNPTRLRDSPTTRAPNPPHFHPPTLPHSHTPTHLPRPLTEFIGRRKEVAEIAILLTRTRLLTLAGAGGVGKTRLAIEVADQSADEFPDGVWFVDLAPLDPTAPVAQAVASTLGLQHPGDVLEALLGYLAQRRLLLVLDNCEHLTAACASLAESLLRAAHGLRLLATSRHALGVPGETVWRVPSLSLELPPGADAQQSEAVQLFLQRAAAARPTFALTPENTQAVLQICRRLDGIPLALELAAGRLNVLGVEQIASRLDDRFRLLTGGNQRALPRQQTLRAAMEWSYALLSPPERVLLQRLSVFAGSFSLEEAEAGCGSVGVWECGSVGAWKCGSAGVWECGSTEGVDAAGDQSRILRHDVLDLLAALVDKSLVWVEERSGEAAYRLLETTREYALEALASAGEEAAVRDRHGSYFLALAERAASALEGPDQRRWLDRLGASQDNLRAALAWMLPAGSDEAAPAPPIGSGRNASPDTSGPRSDRSDEALRLVVALAPYWVRRGPAGEGARWLERALTGGTGRTEARARALVAAGTVATTVTGWDRARALFLEAVEVYEELGDRPGVARALCAASGAAARLLDLPAARSCGERSLRICRELNDAPGVVRSLLYLARAAWLGGDYPEARALLLESLSVADATGDPVARARTLHDLGLLSHIEEDFAASLALQAESLAIRRELGDLGGTAWALDCLGDAALAAGTPAEAAVYYRESLALFHDMERLYGIAECLRGLAEAALAENGSPAAATRAARLFGAQHALRSSSRFPINPWHRAGYESALAAAETVLGADAYRTAFEAGTAMPLEDAVAEALCEK